RSLHRLGAARRQIDNREAAMPEAYSTIGGIPLTATVRTARSHVVAHANKFVPIHGSCSRAVGVDACNAAHIKYHSICEKPSIQFCRYSRTGSLSASARRWSSGGDQRKHANGSSPKVQQVRSHAIAQHPKAAIDLQSPFSMATAVRAKCTGRLGPPQRDGKRQQTTKI